MQGDISTGNLVLNEEDGNPSWPAIFIDCDLAIKEHRDGPPGARAKIGTRAFMAIGLLLGERHFYMHDLKSFYWVLFWICVYYHGPDNGGRVVLEFDEWNSMATDKLAQQKRE